MSTKITIDVKSETQDTDVQLNKAFFTEQTLEAQLDIMYRAHIAMEKEYLKYLRSYALEHGKSAASKKVGVDDVRKAV